MKALPRFLYALHNTPFPVEPGYFRAINTSVAALLWNGKIARIAMTKLTRSWYDGGIALPDIKIYYWASQLTVINKWLHAPQDEPAYRMDRHLLGPDGVMTALYNNSNKMKLTGPTQHAIHVWHVAQTALKWDGIITQATPLWDTRKLGNLRNSKGFKQWDLIGISQVGDLWKKGKILTFAQLQATYKLSQTEHYRYIQIKHALNATIPTGSSIPEASPLEDRLLTDHLHTKAISHAYKKIINNMPDPLTTLRERWVADIKELDDSDWQDAIASPKDIAIPSPLKLIQLKVLHRIYYTRTLLHKMGRIDTLLCARQCGKEGSFYHTLWDCPIIAQYWTAVMNIISQVTSVTIRPDVKLCILNIWQTTDLTQAMQDWATLGMTLAKRNIAKKWGVFQPPTQQQWCNDLDNAMMSEKSVYIHRGCPKKWSKIWGKWNSYRGYICDPPREQLTSDDSDP